MASTIEERLADASAKLIELRETFQDITQTEIPHSLGEAINRRWELIPNGIEAAILAHYPLDQQERDSRRVISLGKAIDILTKFENNIVAHNTRGPARLLWDQLTSFTRRIVYWLDNAYRLGFIIGETITTISFENWWDFIYFPALAESIISAFKVAWMMFTLESIQALIVAAEVTALRSNLVNTFQERNDHGALMLHRAFPQRDGRRYRRRKRTRR